MCPLQMDGFSLCPATHIPTETFSSCWLNLLCHFQPSPLQESKSSNPPDVGPTLQKNTKGLAVFAYE